MKPIFYQILFFFCFCSSYAQTKDKPKVLDAKIENTQQTKEEKYTRSIPSKYFMTKMFQETYTKKEYLIVLCH